MMQEIAIFCIVAFFCTLRMALPRPTSCEPRKASLWVPFASAPQKSFRLTRLWWVSVVSPQRYFSRRRAWLASCRPPCATRVRTSCSSTSTTPASATGHGTSTAHPLRTTMTTHREPVRWCARPLHALLARLYPSARGSVVPRMPNRRPPARHVPCHLTPCHTVGLQRARGLRLTDFHAGSSVCTLTSTPAHCVYAYANG